MPVTILGLLVGLAAVVWKLERSSETASIESETAIYRVQFARRLDGVIQDQLLPLRRRWVAAKFASQDKFAAAAASLLSENQSLVMMGWVDEGGVCRRVVGDVPNGLIVGQAVGGQWSDLIVRAHERSIGHRHGAVSDVQTNASLEPTLWGALPGTDGSSQDATGPGAVVFVYRLRSMLQGLADPIFSGSFSLELRDAGNIFFSLPPHTAADETLSDLTPTETVQIMDRSWTIRITPTEAYIQQHVARFPMWSLWTWLIGGLVLLFSTYQAAMYRRWNDRRLGRYLKALEAVTETSAAILSKVGSSGEVWQRLPEAARALTSMSMACVAVLENGTLRFVASAGIDPQPLGRRYTLEQMPASKRCIESGRPLAVPDLQYEEKPVNRTLAAEYGIRSLLMVPLIVEGQTIGVMMVSSREPRTFTSLDVRLSELWGLLAGVTIAKERLYEQMSRALESRDQLLEQRDALFNVDATIARHGSVEEILQRIVDLAPVPLGVDVCQVNLLSEAGDELVVGATTSHYHEKVKGYRYRLEGTNSGKAIALRKVVVVEDGPENPALQTYLRTQLPCGSIVYTPLLGSSGNPMGLLVFLREKPGKFSGEQLNLMKLFATQAAAAIENAQLYQQIRRDAEAKAMLLRELTHRVKNNLASIGALLAIDVPQLSPRAGKWLDRVTDRIRTMAQTHEMFSGGLERAPIRVLVDHAITSLAAISGKDVNMRAEIDDPAICLKPERAVSVAMVLHELCYNALVHGLAEQGNLLVRVEIANGSDLVIDVIDDGKGFLVSGSEIAGERENELQEMSGAREGGVATASPAATERSTILNAARTGLGLRLVRDFVSRELRGQFTIISTVGKGTRARLRFALLPDEMSDKAPYGR
ncbi:MAG: GAF domain-containing protein [Planctomycetota bacterium]|nr:GAF domain-containing protein [Planctomycetota bacterium]